MPEVDQSMPEVEQSIPERELDCCIIGSLFVWMEININNFPSPRHATCTAWHSREIVELSYHKFVANRFGSTRNISQWCWNSMQMVKEIRMPGSGAVRICKQQLPLKSFHWHGREKTSWKWIWIMNRGNLEPLLGVCKLSEPYWRNHFLTKYAIKERWSSFWLPNLYEFRRHPNEPVRAPGSKSPAALWMQFNGGSWGKSISGDSLNDVIYQPPPYCCCMLFAFNLTTWTFQEFREAFSISNFIILKSIIHWQ